MNTQDCLSLLIQLVAMIFIAAVFGYGARRLKQPAILGEFLGGILIGPTVLGALAPSFQKSLFPFSGNPFAAREAVVKISLLFFLFAAGMEANLSLLQNRRKQILITSLSGILIPFITGFCIVWFFPALWTGEKHSLWVLAAFLGTALSISALPVIARVLMDCNLLKTPLGVMIISSAMIDDLIGWSLFTLLLTFAIPEAHASHSSLLYLGTFLAGAILAPKAGHRTKIHHTFLHLAEYLFAPLYFVSVGLKADFGTGFDFLLTVVVLSVACLGKMIGAGGGAWISGASPREALAIGFGMNARGAMEIILASLALDYGLINPRVFVALVITALLTSLLSGPAMKTVLGMPANPRFFSRG